MFTVAFIHKKKKNAKQTALFRSSVVQSFHPKHNARFEVEVWFPECGFPPRVKASTFQLLDLHTRNTPCNGHWIWVVFSSLVFEHGRKGPNFSVAGSLLLECDWKLYVNLIKMPKHGSVPDLCWHFLVSHFYKRNLTRFWAKYCRVAAFLLLRGVELLLAGQTHSIASLIGQCSLCALSWILPWSICWLVLLLYLLYHCIGLVAATVARHSQGNCVSIQAASDAFHTFHMSCRPYNIWF